MLIDSHCHIVEEGNDAYAKVASINIADKLCVMSSDQTQWQAVESFYEKFPEKIIPAFGVHPWRVETLTSETDENPVDNLLKNLRIILEKYPRALVGEIGLDGVAVHPETKELYNEKVQVELFVGQWKLAAEMNRPVSVHCVKNFALFFETVRTIVPAPPKVMMHSFTGSAEFAEQLMRIPQLKDKIYFSYSKVINLRSWKCKKVIKQLPDNRILVESDLHCCTGIEEGLLDMIAVIKSAKNWDINQAKQQIEKNSIDFFEGYL